MALYKLSPPLGHSLFEANVHAHVDVIFLKVSLCTGVLVHTAIPLDIIIFLTHAG